jgi:hypothetical protein
MSSAPTETAKQTYFHGLAYVLPTTAFWLFADFILMPRIELIWEQAGNRAARAVWVINLSRAFADHFHYIIAGIVLILVLLEHTWPRWPEIRRPAIRFLAWLFTFSVMACITWTGVAACLAAPMALSK